MKLRIAPILSIATVSMAPACTGDHVKSQLDARDTSDSFISQRYNMGDLSDFNISVNETSNAWTFTYDIIDENWTGGPLFVTVDKQSGKVVNHGGAQ